MPAEIEVWIAQEGCEHWSFWLEKPLGDEAKKCLVPSLVVDEWIRAFEAADDVEFELQDAYNAS